MKGPSTSSPAVQGKLRALDKERRGRLEHDLKGVLASPGGCRVLLWIVYEIAGRETGASLRGEEATYHNGARHVSDLVLSEVDRVSPGALSQAIADEHAARAEEKRLAEAAHTQTADEAEGMTADA